MSQVSQADPGLAGNPDEPSPAGHGYLSSKDAYLKRLRRIEGQVGGLSRMVADERYCIDILTQISAIRSALDRVAIAVLDDHARHCVVAASEGKRDERTTEMMDAVARLLKSR